MVVEVYATNVVSALQLACIDPATLS